MKKHLTIICLTFVVALMAQNNQSTVPSSVNDIAIDFSVIEKQNVKGASGANLCWLLDSDKYRPRTKSMKTALTELGVGALRFPYGHLADNYLWTTPPYENAVSELTARVATMSQAPGKWDWCVRPDGTFKEVLDFDEYITLCKNVGAEPLIMVNVLSFRYEGGPTLESLITSAAEWVRYSNIIRKYNVKYWQLGNEVEHTKEITLTEYVDIYGKMAAAMKAVDPTIKVGTGVLGQTAWNKAVLEKHPDLVSFVSAHQYTFNQPFTEKGYEGWKEQVNVELRNIRRTQSLLLEKPEYKNIEIMITETGSTGGKWPEGRTNDLYKALNWFEMNMEELLLPNVKYSFFWGTHSPWSGENTDTGLEYLLTTKDNNTTPTGRIIELINNYMPAQIVKTDRVSGFLRTYAGISKDKKELSIFILNKNDKVEKINLNISGINFKSYLSEKIIFTGTSPVDIHPKVSKSKGNKVSGQQITETVTPYSLTILRYYKKK
jgi:alpha-L-arabinofuranosidase